MPRIRTIKPEFWTDKKIIRLSRDARLFFIGLWNFADDNGVVEADPLQLKALIFPVDPDIGVEEIEKLLSELESLELIKIYEIDGIRYLWIINFLKHQKIDKPRKSNLPLPPNSNSGSQESQIISNKNENLPATPDNNESFKKTSDEKETFQMISDEVNKNQMKSSDIIPKEKENREENEGKTHVSHSQNSGSEDLKSGADLQLKIPPCPYQEIVSLYHRTLPELPQVRVLNETRKKYVKARWREVLTNNELAQIFLSQEEMREFFPNQWAMLWFKRYFEYVKESDFLCGRYTPSGNRSSPFQADFEWLMRPTNFIKVLEGRYHKKQPSTTIAMGLKAQKTAMAAMALIKKWQEQEKQEEQKTREEEHVAH